MVLLKKFLSIVTIFILLMKSKKVISNYKTIQSRKKYYWRHNTSSKP